MKKCLIMLIGVLVIIAMVSCGGEQTAHDVYEYPDRSIVHDGQSFTGGAVTYPTSLWSAPNTFRPPSEYDRAGVTSVFLESVMYNGLKTRVFAYYGLPEGASEQEKVPGMVLVHGGGGTAYSEWVELWNAKGYAAIAIDTEGKIPNATGTGSTAHAYGGPSNDGNYGAGLSDYKLGFPYHATSAAIVANSFLRAFNEVDETKIGITGISWGGVMTAITIGYDSRFAFAVPVYGGINMNLSYGRHQANNPAALMWTDPEPVKHADMPILWLNTNRDTYFSCNATTKCYADSQVGFMSLIDSVNHSHAHGWGEDIIEGFASSVVNGLPKLIKISKQPAIHDNVLEYLVPNGTEVAGARLYYNELPVSEWYIGDSLNPANVWKSENLSASDGRISFEIPETATAFYIQLTDERNFSVASNVIVL